MTPAPIKIAIYDMDKTITRRATYNGFLLHMLMRRAPWRLILLPLLLLALPLFMLRIWDRRQLKQFSQALFVGGRVDLQSLRHHVDSYADKVMDSNIYPEARARLAQEKRAGYRHVIATASYRLYAEAIAQRLGFDDVIATDLVTDDTGYIHARIDGDNCYGAAKLLRVKEWMAAQGLERQYCHLRAYSDHISDAPLLEFADEAFAANPHKPLRQLAEQRGWTILDWR